MKAQNGFKKQLPDATKVITLLFATFMGVNSDAPILRLLLVAHRL
jgi:hypothetical protein